MSLNLISSLSFLKSKLGSVPTRRTLQPPAPPPPVKCDIFGGVTESDLDTSSSDSEDGEEEEEDVKVAAGSTISSSSSRESSGLSTPNGTKSGRAGDASSRGSSSGPTADILQKCLDILNSDISDSETQPQPDVERRPLVVDEDDDDDNDEDDDDEVPVKPSVTTDKDTKEKPPVHYTNYSQGLLKIASPPRREDSPPPPPTSPSFSSKKNSSHGKRKKFPPARLSHSPSSPYPTTTSSSSSSPVSPGGDDSSDDDLGPPLLEPMVSRAEMDSRRMTVSSTAVSTIFPAATTAASLRSDSWVVPSSMSQGSLTSVTHSSSNNFTSSSSGGSSTAYSTANSSSGCSTPLNINSSALHIPSSLIPPSSSSSSTVSGLCGATAPISQPLPLSRSQAVSTFPRVSVSASQSCSTQPSFVPAGAASQQPLLLPPPGQQQILMPPVPASGHQPQQIMLPPVQAGQLPQQIFLPPVQAGQPQQIILQPPPSGLQQQPTSTVVSMVPQPQQATTTFQTVQQQQQQPMVQIVENGFPLQFTSAPIPLLSAQGQFLGTVGGVTNQAQLVSSLQGFTTLLIQNNNQMQQQAVVGGQKPFFNPGQIQLAPPVSLGQQGGAVFGSSYPGGGFLTATVPQQQQPQQQQTQMFSIAIKPEPGLVAGSHQLQSAGMGLQASSAGQVSYVQCLTTSQSTGGSSAVSFTSPAVTAGGCYLTSLAPPVKQERRSIATPTSSATPPAALPLPAASPMAHLVQDPVTGLYNLVQTGPANSTPPLPPATPLLAQSPLLPQSPLLAQSPLLNSPAVAVKRPISSSPLLSNISSTPSTSSSSPHKTPKLLLPSTAGAKENKPMDIQLPLPVTKFMCGVCNKYFGNTKNLRVHISEIHEGKRGQFPCDVCGKVFPRKRNMERHKNALHLKNNPMCHLCNKLVVNLDMHIKRFHRGSEEYKKLPESAATA